MLEINNRFENALLFGNEDEVKKCLGMGVSPKKRIEGFPPIALAAQNGNLNIVNLLLSKGANPNKLTNEGYSAVYIATSYDNPKCLQALLEKEADCDKTRFDNATPLYRAAAKGHTQCLMILLKFSADFKKPFKGMLPIEIAAQEGNIECVECLIHAYEKDKFANAQTSPILRSIDLDNKRLLKLYVQKGADINQLYAPPSEEIFYEEGSGDESLESSSSETHLKAPFLTPLMYAAMHGDLKFVKLLLKLGANPNIENEYGMLAIHFAANSGKKEIIEELISYGSELNKETIQGYAPFHIARSCQFDDCVELLVSKGASQEESKVTALFQAIEKGNLSDLSHHLSSIDDINVTDFFGRTAVSLAVYYNQPECLEMLSRSGADINKKDLKGLSPIYLAAAKDHEKCLQVLVEYGGDINTECDGVSLVYIAAQMNSVKTLDFLIQNKADFEAPASDGATPLYKAVSNGNFEATDLLIRAGANVNVDLEGFTPVYMAAQNNHPECLKLLIEAGAKVESEKIKTSPLYRATALGHEECVKLLIHAGANVNTKLDGVPAVYIAVQYNHHECLRMLIEAGAKVDSKAFETSPLFKAATLGHRECLELLVAARANLETTFMELTPLWIAALKGHYDCVQLLLNAGANKNHLDPDGHGVSWAAKVMGNQACFELIRDYGPNAAIYIQRRKINILVTSNVRPESSVSLYLDSTNSDEGDIVFYTGELFGFTEDNRSFNTVQVRSLTMVVEDFEIESHTNFKL